MIAAPFVLAALAALTQGGPADDVRRAIADGRLGDAYDGLAAIEDPVTAARAEADLRYFARDFAASLRAVERGLAHAPHDLLLLHRGLNAALWLRDGDRALALADRLGAALEAADLGADRGWWVAEHAARADDARALVAAADDRERRHARARATALGLLCAAVGAAALLARGKPARASAEPISAAHG